MIKNFFLINFFKNKKFENCQIQKGIKSKLDIFSDNKSKTIIFGNPSFNSTINNENFYKDWKNKYLKKNYSKIDGEFIIIDISKIDNKITIINSRFASPTLFYFIDSEEVLLSNNFFCIAKILKQ